MEIKNLAVLGNTLEARVISLLIGYTNPDINVKIFTNGTVFKNNFKTPTLFQSQMNTTLSWFFEKDLNIPTTEIFNQTKTTLNLTSTFTGIADDEIVLPLSFNLNYIFNLLRYNCFSKNFLKDQNIDIQFRALLEWLIQNNYSLLDLTLFPIEAYRNDPEADLYFRVKEFSSNYDTLTSQFVHEVTPQFTCSTIDIDGLSKILESHINNIPNIQWITEPIHSFRDNVNSSLESNPIKLITAIQINDTPIDVDFVVDAGIDIEYIDNFIELMDGESLYTENEITPFKYLKQYKAKILEKPGVLRQDLIDNGIRVHLNYENETIIQEYQIEDNDINVTQGYNSNLLYDSTLEVKSQALDKNLQIKNIVNQKYHSNYVCLNIKKLGLNYVVGEQFKSLIAFSRFINGVVGQITIDPRNWYVYVNNIENSWDSFRNEINSMTYYIMRGHKRRGLDFLNNPPEIFKNRFDAWGDGFPELNYLNYFGEPMSGMYLTRKTALSGTGNISFLKYPFMEFDYCTIAQQKNQIKTFKFDFTNNNDVFKDIYYMQKYMYNSFIYEQGFYNFTDFKSFHLI